MTIKTEKKSLAEAAQEILKASVAKAQAAGDPPKKLPGEVETLNEPITDPLEDGNVLPNPGKKIKKDSSAPTANADAGDPMHKLHKEEDEAPKDKEPIAEEENTEEGTDPISEAQGHPKGTSIEHPAFRQSMRSGVLGAMHKRLKKHKGKNVSIESLHKALTNHDAKSGRRIHGLMWELQKHGHKITPVKSGKRVTHYSLSEEGEVQDVTLDSVSLQEHVNVLFDGETLSEEFKTKASTIFEAAVSSEVKKTIDLYEEFIDSLLDLYEETAEEFFNDKVKEINETYEASIDDALNYIAEAWVNENKVAIESNLKTELVEEFITGLKALCEEHYITFPEEKVDVVQELSNKVAKLEENLNVELQKNIKLTTLIFDAEKEKIVEELSEGLSDNQKAQLKTLAEEVKFTTVAEYTTKVQTIKESYFKKDVQPTNDSKTLEQEAVLTEEEIAAKEKAEKGLPGTDASISAYVKALDNNLFKFQ
jgi:hypothetical protein